MSYILVLSYNEGNKNFEKIQCEEVMEKINKIKPDLIILCSQESRYNANNLGSVLNNNYLSKKYNYIKHDRYSKKILERGIKFLPNIITNYGDVRTKIFIKDNFSFKELSEKSKSIDFTLGKGSIMSKIEFNNNKFIFVNSHYAFKGSGNTGLEKRTEQFFETINKFQLYKYVNTHQIFFCGDLNFRLDEKYFNKYIKNENIYTDRYIPWEKNQKTENITLNKNNLRINYSKFKKLYYFINKLQEFTELKKPYEYNELYKIISSDKFLKLLSSPRLSEILNIKINNELKNNIIKLYNNFKESIEKTGIYITCRYREGKKISNSVKYNDKGLVKLKRLSEKSIDNIKKIKEKVNICNSIISCEKNGTLRVPSMCDKILYSFTDKLNKKIEFFTFLTPNISDHKMVGILCKIDNKSERHNNSETKNLH